jgi:glc operon protein GlcG
MRLIIKEKTMRLLRDAVSLAALTLAIGAAQAQIAEKKTLTLDGARRVMAAAMSEIKRNNTTGVVAIVDDGGNLMMLERADNTFAAGANISIGKARTAAIFKRPTRLFEEIIKNGRTAMVALNDFTPLQGGVPIIVDGQIVGAIGVSGAASAQQDEEIAVFGANALSGNATSMPSASMPVLFFDREKVAEAFSKGAVLFGGEDGRNYMIHASRREKPGMAEVHAEETDLIYVQSGSAMFVTGGTVVEGKTTAPGEIRGTAIQNGETRRLTRGDVIIVPKGVPHWFQQIDAPFTYYVVKVR